MQRQKQQKKSQQKSLIKKKSNLAVHFSSLKDDWETPQELFDELDKLFAFDLDVCASAENKKCEDYIFGDSLETDWDEFGKTCWMNPPYGRGIGKWVKKAYEQAKFGSVVVCLLPARTDTAWFHEFCRYGTVIFLRGRLRFVGATHSAPFPSMIVVFGQVSEALLRKFQYPSVTYTQPS